MSAPATVAVIGSTCFTATHFITEALKRGCRVLGFSRSEQPPLPFRPYAWDASLPSPVHHRLDLNTELDAIDAILRHEKPAWVVNYAAQGMVGESWKMPEQWFQTNTLAQVRLHERLRQYDFLDRYLHCSTPEVYGAARGNLTEAAPFNPSSPYAVSKAAADLSLLTYFRQYGFPVVFTRSANVYGPGQQLYRVVPKAILAFLLGRPFQLQGGGQVIRSFVHIQDVTDAAWRVLEQGRIGEAYHVGPEEQLSIRALVEQIAALMDVAPASQLSLTPGRPGEDAAYRLDCTRIRTELGWQDRLSLQAGLEDTIAWARRWAKDLALLPDSYIHRA